jgi:hypothetical protein
MSVEASAIVKTAQEILPGFQGPDYSRRPLVSCLCQEFRRVAELLQRNAPERRRSGRREIVR